jgi:MauM/NapG family ferredoxin protein
MTERRTSRGRRALLGGVVASTVAGVAAWLGPSKRVKARMWLRPPGAKKEAEFLDACARCFKCGSACPNGCIQFHGLADGLEVAFTPYIHARTRGCILCGDCADVCPTGALKPFTATRDGWLAGVDMGKARVNKDLCYSFHGRTCGACYRACPLAGQAMKIGVFETPLVQPANCVGCGLCEQACLHLPQAIRVLPNRMIEVAESEI